ncbi:hypothetical protein [Candidatus Deferrimicrobium sp.]|uniref:hypothetical protein n=1 Tax=Candidatus Deferrimicrobium sp. TaxID=3060586 RepID=UPI003C50D4E0
MAAQRKNILGVGMIMAIVFIVILTVMFTPIFGGKNAFEAADNFFNSIAKGSTYFIPGLMKDSESYNGKTIDVTVTLPDKAMTATAVKLFKASGALVGEGESLRVAGDLGQISRAALQDADAMFFNRGKQVTDKYGVPEKEVLFTWWTAFKEMEKDLKRQKKFPEAAWLSNASKRSLEVGYNFYRIETRKVSTVAGMLLFSLVFYVAYTLWWGYAVLFLFEGAGLQMKAGAKKEV